MLLSSSLERKWGDPTTFGFLELLKSADDPRYTQRQGQGDIDNAQERRMTGMITSGETPSEKDQLTPSSILSISSLSKTDKGVVQLVSLKQIPEYGMDIHLSEKAFMFGYRGRVGVYHPGFKFGIRVR